MECCEFIELFEMALQELALHKLPPCRHRNNEVGMKNCRARSLSALPGQRLIERRRRTNTALRLAIWQRIDNVCF